MNWVCLLISIIIWALIILGFFIAPNFIAVLMVIGFGIMFLFLIFLIVSLIYKIIKNHF